MTGVRTEAVIHCTAWTAVEDEDKRKLVYRINAKGTGYIAEAAKAIDAKMLYLSTDYVFDGQGERLFNSQLNKSKLAEAGFIPLPTWQVAVARYLKEAKL